MIHIRRKFLIGLGTMLAAPAIVHAGNLMPVKALAQPVLREIDLLDAYGRSPAMDVLADLQEFRRMWKIVVHEGMEFVVLNAEHFLMEPK